MGRNVMQGGTYFGKKRHRADMYYESDCNRHPVYQEMICPKPSNFQIEEIQVQIL